MSNFKSSNEKVREFYKGFNQEEFISQGPASLDESNINEERLHLKMTLIAEEFIELAEAVYGREAGVILEEAWHKAQKSDDHTRDIVETADALGDLVYVIEGLNIEAGIPSDRIFDEIHDSNMSKLDDNGNPVLSDGVTPAKHDGKIKPAGKILKGDNYFDPDLKAIIEGEEPDRTPKIIKDAKNN